MSVILASVVLVTGIAIQQDFIAENMKWRANREATLRKPEGWLTVAGLFWLDQGVNTLGTATGSKVLLPKGSGANGDSGYLVMKSKSVSIVPDPNSKILINGAETKTTTELKTDAEGKPDTVQIGSVTFRIIVRGKRTGVRLYDSNSIYMKEFSGCHWYPVNSSFRIKAKFTPYAPPKKASILNILGDTETVTLPGYVEFSINGKACRLDAQNEGDTLFFNFKDLTSGTLTYPPGRFLNTPKPVDGYVDLDFNHAVNPPCAYTAFATCPLPPKSNILNVRISAGELVHHPVK